MINYVRFIEDNFKIINKELKAVAFHLNPLQRRYMTVLAKFNDIILKFRQGGFSSLIEAIFTADFILEENSYSVVVADIDENAEMLLEKVKYYIHSYEETNKQEVPLKYESKQELYNPFMNSRFSIGTARNVNFGRSRTISNLHCSEIAFYPNIEGILSGVKQSLIPGGKAVFETTANGFNDFKKFYENAKRGVTDLNALFFKGTEFYDGKFLDKKRIELGKRFPQEYPETDIEAFLTSGDCYFEANILQGYYKQARKIDERGNLVYAIPQTV